MITIQTDDDEDLIGVTEPIAKLIRKCWSQDPSDRVSFSFVLEQLQHEISFYKASGFVRATTVMDKSEEQQISDDSADEYLSVDNN